MCQGCVKEGVRSGSVLLEGPGYPGRGPVSETRDGIGPAPDDSLGSRSKPEVVVDADLGDDLQGRIGERDHLSDHPLSPVGIIARVLDAEGWRAGECLPL